jgi:hypothetical protein
MLVASLAGHNLYQFSLTNVSVQSLIDSSSLSGLGRLGAIAYDSTNKDIYVTGTGPLDTESPTVIGKFSVTGNTFVPLYTDLTG